MRVLVSGSHGFIGTALVERLEELGHEVIRLVRDKPNQDDEIAWQPVIDGSSDDLEGFDAVVCLGGRSIGERRWTLKEKSRIWDSRLDLTEVLSHRLAEVVSRPEVFVCSSAIGYYGDGGDDILTEKSPRGDGFLAHLAENWEDATKHASEVGIRVVNVRTAVVLGPDGGALKRQIPLFRLGLGGRLGTGQQYMSWISLRDAVEAMVHVMTHRKLRGPVNLTSPQPIMNIEFTKALGHALRRPTWIPVWRWMLRLAFGSQLPDELLLVSQRAVPKKLQASNFRFQDPDIETALIEMLRSDEPHSEEGASDDAETSEIIDLDKGTKRRSRSKRKGER